MAFDLEWDHQFCLGCDKQTDGATYCSESCRLADFEKTASTSSSASSSPASSSPSSPWTFSKPTSSSSSTRFYLSPAYDFANAQPYGSTPMSRRAFPSQHQRAQSSSLTPPARMLSPSSSHSSLCSVQSSASTATTASAEISQLSDKARRELQAYAISFAQVRLQRRRSY